MYIEVNVDVPYLGVFVDFLDKVELFFKFFPFLRCIIAFSMKSTYNDLAWGHAVPLGQYLSTDNLVIVENLPGLLSAETKDVLMINDKIRTNKIFIDINLIILDLQ